jgi:hypothetical protein
MMAVAGRIKLPEIHTIKLGYEIGETGCSFMISQDFPIPWETKGQYPLKVAVKSGEQAYITFFQASAVRLASRNDMSKVFVATGSSVGS